MKPESKLLIGLLRQSVAKKKTELSFDVDWKNFYMLCRAHMLGPLAYEALKQSLTDWAVVPKEIRKVLYKIYMFAFRQDFFNDTTKAQLHEALVKNGITHVFLKGAVLKNAYPVPALRTMCDMDILVRTEDYKKLDKVMFALGAKSVDGDGNHRSFRFPNGVYVEFHPNLLHHATPMGTGINPGWQYTAVAADGSTEMTEEGFYLHTLCHLLDHFTAGGVGVRFVLDLWVNRHLRKPEPDWAFVEAEQERLGIGEIARNIEALAEAWFGDGEMTPLLEEMGEYILDSGSHGRHEQATLNAVSLSGNRKKALLKKAFYPRQELEDRFPWSKGRPLLLPAAWCVRAFQAVTRRGHLILKWSKGTRDITNDEVAAHRKKLERFGIRLNEK